jgi:hypothetical protein
MKATLFYQVSQKGRPVKELASNTGEGWVIRSRSEAAAVRTHRHWRLGVALAGLLAVPLAVGDATGALSMAENP